MYSRKKATQSIAHVASSKFSSLSVLDRWWSGSWLCLDMLEGAAVSFDAWSGWTSAYTVRTLLLQLTSFLFDLAPQDHAPQPMPFPKFDRLEGGRF